MGHKAKGPKGGRANSAARVERKTHEVHRARRRRCRFTKRVVKRDSPKCEPCPIKSCTGCRTHNWACARIGEKGARELNRYA